MAAVFAGGFTYVVFMRLRRSSTQPRLLRVVAAAKDLAAGITLTPDHLILLDWPADVPLRGSFSNVDAVVGRPLIYSLGADEPVLARDLAVAGSGIGISGRIPPGMRATAVRSNEIVGVAGFLFPGSHVDVVATFTPPGSPGSITQTLLQDVEVLTAGTATEPDPQGKPQTVSVVTLLLSPEDSQRLLLVSAQGTIQFVLRSGVDKQRNELIPTRLEQLVGAAPKLPSPPVITTGRTPKKVEIRKEPELPKAPEVYVLEVIQGTQRSVQKF